MDIKDAKDIFVKKKKDWPVYLKLPAGLNGCPSADQNINPAAFKSKKSAETHDPAKAKRPFLSEAGASKASLKAPALLRLAGKILGVLGQQSGGGPRQIPPEPEDLKGCHDGHADHY